MNNSHSSLKPIVYALVICGTALLLGQAGFCDEPADTGDDQGAEVQTRGPVHEAFAGIVTFNPEAGVAISKAPPEAIEEVPPDEKPAGDNVVWIPGYWAWDDERNDFLWISGVWRALPPGRQWLPGYWTKTAKGYQWISGYWADAKVTETTYLPPPPTSIERGPNIDPPSPDYIWTPGCWIWIEGRYAWRPGYWVLARPDWDWCPAYYSWTPRGYVYVDGYWDYTVERRGILFAPVYFNSGYYARRGYYYAPRIVIDLAIFPDHLFLRPSYHHYYFGDYYAANYYRSGFYFSFSFQSRRYGYDPIYTQRRWENRNDRNWERTVATNYKYRRDNVDARPPRTWADQTKLTPNDRSRAVGATIDQVSKRHDSPQHFQPVPKEEKQQIVQRSQEVRQSRDNRRTVETTGGDAPKGKSGKPTTVERPRSPIVAPVAESPRRDRPPANPQQPSGPTSNIENSRQPDQLQPDNRDRSGRSQGPGRREPEVLHPPQRVPVPETQAPIRRSPPATVQPAVPSDGQPVVVPPSAQQPIRRGGKPAPSTDSQRDDNRGDGHGDRNRDDDQPGRSGRQN